jgi:ATP-binding cassette, subfamily C, bacterial CydC
MAASPLIFRLLYAQEPRPVFCGESAGAPGDEDNGAIRVKFNGVTFGYSQEGPAVLNDLTLDIAQGKTTALVGRSGSGKSTVINLLCGFYPVWQGDISWEFDRGDILINGRSIREYTLESLRAQIAVVPQEVYLFNTSIVENLRISAPTATDEDIQNAAKAAVAHAFILALPNGYDTVVGERGARLSGGQRQRIAITRALLKDSRILVLDEASSSLDSENENRLNAALNLLKKNRCTIVIAHRLSTLRNADRVVFLNEGRLVDIGKFDELIMRCPLFAETTGIDGEGESQHNENQ